MKTESDHILKMRVWYDGAYAPSKDRRAVNVDARAEHQKDWDSAILAAAELIRRIDGGDDVRALAIYGLLSTNLPRG